MYWLIWLLTLLFLLRNYFYNVFTYWERRGVPTPPYKFLFGHMWPTCIFTKNFGVIMTEIYQQFEGYRYVGFYNFTRKGIVLRDTELIRNVLVKDFNSFHDNNFDISEEHDIIFGKNPFVLKGERWKVVRAQVTPSFTTGKVKAMMPLLHANNEKLLHYLARKTSTSACLEAKELCSKVTCENVASCAFGLDGGCFLEEHSEFREMGRLLSHPSFMNGLKRFCLFIVPSLSKILKVKFFFDEITNFLRKIVRETLEFRKTNNVVRNDFLDAMQDLYNKIGDDKVFGEDDILAHAGGFFLDGFETSAVAISHILYDLAANVHVQEKLREEIEGVIRRYGSLTFDEVQDMQYLDCVIKESLRLHVPLLTLGKLCTKPYKLPPPRIDDREEKEVLIEANTIVVVPAWGLQLDAKYFPEPEKYLPERFAEENKEKINRFAYLPFGEGPRICPGSKFGILQTKMCIIAIIEKYKLSVNSKTKVPWELDGFGVMNIPVGGLWLNFDPNMEE